MASNVLPGGVTMGFESVRIGVKEEISHGSSSKLDKRPWISAELAAIELL